MEIRNINPLGDVDDLLIGRVVKHREVVEVTEKVGKDRIKTGNYEAVEADSKKG